MKFQKGVPYRSGSSAYGRRSRGSRRDNNSRQWRGLAFSLGPAAANVNVGASGGRPDRFRFFNLLAALRLLALAVLPR